MQGEDDGGGGLRGRGDAPRGALKGRGEGAHPHAHLHRAHLVRDDARGGGGGLGSRRGGLLGGGILARVRELLAHVLLRAPGIAARPETLELQTPRPAGDGRARGGLGDVQARLLAKAHAERSPPEHVRVFEEIAHGPARARRPPGVAHVRVLDDLVRDVEAHPTERVRRRRGLGARGRVGGGKGAGVNERHAGSGDDTKNGTRGETKGRHARVGVSPHLRVAAGLRRRGVTHGQPRARSGVPRRARGNVRAGRETRRRGTNYESIIRK